MIIFPKDLAAKEVNTRPTRPVIVSNRSLLLSSVTFLDLQHLFIEHYNEASKWADEAIFQPSIAQEDC